MLVEKQIQSLSKLYPIYEGVPKNFWDESEVYSFFYRNSCDIALSHNLIFWVSKQILIKTSLPSTYKISAM